MVDDITAALSLAVSDSTFTTGTIKVLDPNSSQILSQTFAGPDSDLTFPALSTTGTYTIIFDPAAYTGTLTLSLYDPPKWTTSRYLDTTSPDTLYQYGRDLGVAVFQGTQPQKSLVILDYGCQQTQGAVWGAKSSNLSVFNTMGDLKGAIEAFGRGFYDGTGSNHTAQLWLALGTNNDDCVVSSDAGKQWALAINDINEYFASTPAGFPYAQQITAIGANDIEINFCSTDPCPANARAWATAFGTWAIASWFENYGACKGCPPAGPKPDGDWTEDDIYYVSWAAPAAWPLPEIFADNGVNAAQYERLSEYGLSQPFGALNFDGVETEYQACQQRPCDHLDNTPNQGWGQLWRALNSKADYDGHKPPAGVHDSLPYLTDIKWPG